MEQHRSSPAAWPGSISWHDQHHAIHQQTACGTRRLSSSLHAGYRAHFPRSFRVNLHQLLSRPGSLLADPSTVLHPEIDSPSQGVPVTFTPHMRAGETTSRRCFAEVSFESFRPL